MTLTTPAAPSSGNAAGPVFELRDVTAGYSGTTVLRNLSMTVPAGSVTALLGPNGAGKTTLIRVGAGRLRPSSGQVFIDGTDVTQRAAHRRNRAGLCLVPEGRGVFPSLSVRENLILQVSRADPAYGVDRALDAFPRLKPKLRQLAGTLSGGEQQMVALARCFLRQPRVVLLDEVSMGLAPLVIDEIFTSLRTLADEGVALVIVEQYVDRALELADSVHVLRRGSTVFQGAPSAIDRDELVERYLGGGQ